MAIIYSYPLNTPKREDLLIGTVTYDENAQDPVVGNPTVSFTVGSLLDLVAAQGAAQNLQQVTNIGNTTTNSIVISNSLKVAGGYYDSSNQPGTSGQILSSTATGTQWVNVAAQGVTSVGLSMPAAFTVANSPVTQSGTLTVTGAGTAAQYINGLGNLVTFPTIPAPYILPVATTVALGGIKIGYTQNAKNYPVVLSNEQAYVNVPWTDTPYVLPLAADGTRGGVQIGYVENGKNYPVELSSEKMFVNVPWTDTPYVLPVATSSDLGGVKIGYTENAKNYPVELDSDQMFVNVPWTDTQTVQTITGTGSDNTDSGILLSDSGGTVLILGAGSVTAAQTGNTITLTGTDTGVTGVTLATADSVGAPLVESITNRELTLTSAKYVGGANVGYVPEGGTSSTYLKGDGTWEAIPTGLIFKGTWDASGGGGGTPDLTQGANKGAGFLWICDVAGTAYPNGGTNPPSTWALGDWAVYDGTAWTRVPATNSGVTSLTTTDGTFIGLTPNTATTGAVTVTADLSAADGNNTGTSQRFLTKNNTWAVPAYTTDNNTTYTVDVPANTTSINLKGSDSSNDAIVLTGGTNVTLSRTDASTIDIAATDTQENTTWYIRDSADSDKTVNNLKYLKFVTATGALDTALTGAGTTGDPYLMTLTSPDTNTQNTYTAGAGLSVSNFVFSADIDTTAASSATNNLSTDTGRYYAVQLDNNSTAADRKMVVNVPWSSGGTYDWTVKDNAANQGSSSVTSGNSIKFVTATGPLGTVLTDPNSDGNFIMTLTSPDTTTNTTYDLAGAADGSVAANYNLVLSADGTAQDTMVFKEGSNVTFTRAANSLTIAADNDNTTYDFLAVQTGGTDDNPALRLDPSAGSNDDITLTGGNNMTITRDSDTEITFDATNTWVANTKIAAGYVAAPGAVANKVWKTDASGNPAWRTDATGSDTTYSIGSGNTKVITLTGSDSSTSTVTFADGNDISISGSNGTITIASTFAEADTLATVTGRGDTTTTKSYFNGDLEVNNTITVTRTGNNNGKISIEGNPPLLELKNYDTQTSSNQLLSSIEFYGSDTSSSNVAGVRASINCNTGFDDPTGTSNRNQGCLEFATYNGTDVGNSPVQRLKITPDGGFSFGATSTAYGTAGQLLKSNGDAPPSWVNAPVNGVTSVAASTDGDALDVSGTPITSTGTLAFTWAGADTEYVNGEGDLVTFPNIPQGDITGVTAGTDLTGGGTSGTVTLDNSSTLGTVTGRGATTTTKSYFNGDLEVKNEITVVKTNVSTPGKITINGNTDATLQLKSEDVALAPNETLGVIEFYGSDGTTPGAGVKSSIRARNGAQTGGVGDTSNLIFAVSDGTSNNNEALRINPTGSIAIDGATKYGTSGQILTSAGDAPPTWETFNGVTGSGTTNTVPRWTSSSNLGDGPLTFSQNSTATWASADTVMGGRLEVGSEGTNSVGSRIAIGAPTGNSSYLYFASTVSSIPANTRQYVMGIDALSSDRSFKFNIQGAAPNQGNNIIKINYTGEIDFNTIPPVGGGNQTTSLRIDNNGNVAIQPGGSTLTNTRLNIVSADHYDPSLYDGMGGIRIGTAASGVVDGNYTGGIGFAVASGTSGIAGVQKGTDGDKQGLAFFTHPSTTGGDAAVEKMRLDADGNLGVGTQSPSGPFHVKVGTSTPLIVSSSSYCNNVGIRTTTPTASLQVKGNISYSYVNYTNVANTWMNVISMAGYPTGLYQISIIKKTNASTYVTAIIKWDNSGSGSGTIANTITSNQLAVSFNNTTTLQAISGISTGTLMSANLKCLVMNEDSCS